MVEVVVLVVAAVATATAGGQATGWAGSLSPMDPRRMMKSQITTMDQDGWSQDLFTCRPVAFPGNWQDHHHLSELNVERI